jgi:hypothetical protein
MNTFYRVCNLETYQGLWYDYKGNFTGLIHNEFKFCANSELRMDFDHELIGWLSAVKELDHLWQWFSKEDVLKLQEHNFFIHQFECDEHRFYERFQHLVINQTNAIPTQKIILL